MLIIVRRAGESLLIGDEIEVRVLDADAEHVRLGVTTPRDIPVQIVDAQASRDQGAAKPSAICASPDAQGQDSGAEKD